MIGLGWSDEAGFYGFWMIGLGWSDEAGFLQRGGAQDLNHPNIIDLHLGGFDLFQVGSPRLDLALRLWPI